MWLKTKDTLINTDNVQGISIGKTNTAARSIEVNYSKGSQVITYGTKEDCQALLDRIKHAILDRVRVLEV